MIIGLVNMGARSRCSFGRRVFRGPREVREEVLAIVPEVHPGGGVKSFKSERLIGYLRIN